MPLFLCRWYNGDCSVMWAPNKEDAIVELGRDVMKHTDMPTVLIDRLVRQGGTKTPKNFKGRGRPS